MRTFLLGLLLAATTANTAWAFGVPQPTSRRAVTRTTFMLNMAEDNDQDRLRALGYSEDEIRRSQKEADPQPQKVRVDLVDDVDSFSLTAIGFALIAINFFVLANLGDGGIGGLVATIINTINQ